MPSTNRTSRLLSRWGLSVLVGVISLTLFLSTLAPTVTAEDSGELIAAAWHFGVPHPPGYPLWTMLCGAFLRIVPFGSIAWRANLFSAACTAGAAAIVCAMLRDLKVSGPVAAGAALTWVWTRWSWSQSVITEVYGLNSLLTAAVLWCGVRWYVRQSTRPLLVASLLMGLGMSNHHTIALAGLAVVVWILVQQPQLALRGRLVAGCIALFVLGLLPYVYLPIRAAADPPINWGNPSNVQRFWEHVSRHQYGALGPMKTEEPRSLVRVGPQLRYAAESICDDLTLPASLLALTGLLYTVWANWRIALLAAFWLIGTGVLFVLLANYDLDRTSRWAMRVFLIPASLGLVVPLACLLDALASSVKRRLASSRWIAVPIVGVLATGAPALQVVSHWRHCDYSNYWYALDHARNMLACMMPGALIFPSGDHSTFPLVYLHDVEDQRPDVLIGDIYGYVSPELCQDKPADSALSDEAWLIKSARRPVYYTTKKRSPVSTASFVPAGLLLHLLPDGYEFDGSNLIASCTYRNIDEPSVQDFGASHILCDRSFSLGLAALDGGRIETAIAHFDIAAAYGWGIKEVYNNIGSALAEHGTDEPAIPYFNKAANLDSRYVLPRWNLFRLHKSAGRAQQAREQLNAVIAANPDDYRAYGELGFLFRDHLGDNAEATRCFEESLRHNPSQPQIVQALADLQG